MLTYGGKPASRRVHAYDGHVRARELDHGTGVGQHHRRARIGQHKGQSLGRVPGIERQIRPAGLERAQHRDGHVQGTRQADGDRNIRPNPHLLQQPGQVIGTLIQGAVTQTLAAALNGKLVRCLGRLALEEIRHRLQCA